MRRLNDDGLQALFVDGGTLVVEERARQRVLARVNEGRYYAVVPDIYKVALADLVSDADSSTYDSVSCLASWKPISMSQTVSKSRGLQHGNLYLVDPFDVSTSDITLLRFETTARRENEW